MRESTSARWALTDGTEATVAEMTSREIEDARPIVQTVLALPRERRMDALATALRCLLDVGALDDHGPRTEAARQALRNLGLEET